MRTTKALALLLLVLPAAGACSSDNADSDTKAERSVSKQVVVKDFAFGPAQISIGRGTTVQWRNDDAFRHTVTSGATSGAENKADGRFDLDLPDKGSGASFTFKEPGTFTYFCRQHNAMDGTVTVT